MVYKWFRFVRLVSAQLTGNRYKQANCMKQARMLAKLIKEIVLCQ